MSKGDSYWQSGAPRARLERHGISAGKAQSSSSGSFSSVQASERLKTMSAMGLSVLSSVSIVTCNKHLMSDLGFRQATTLTGMHTIACVLCMRAALGLGWIEYKSCPRSAVVTFGFTQGISIGLLNLSLSFNSVGFYQMAKLAIIPCTVFIEMIWYQKQFGGMVLCSIFVLLLGVGVATVTDMQLNSKGSILAVLSVLTTCLAQIWTGTTQRRYGLTSSQLLYHASPSMAATLCSTGPVFDYMLTGESVFSYAYTPHSIAFIVASCLIAVAVNMGTFLVIGRCDAITYQVLGHLKTVLVLSYGFLRLAKFPSLRNLFGVGVALVGMVGYGVAKELEKRADTKKHTLPSMSPERAGSLDSVTPIKKL